MNYNANNQNTPRKNKQNAPKLSKKMSFCSILCALSVVILSLGSVFEIIDISTAALASFIVIIAMLELGGYYPVLLYLATSVLSILLLPTKTVAFMYLLFFGFYPILKKYLERLPFWISWIAKFVVFNIIILGYLFLAKNLIFPDIENVKIYLILLLNVIFFTLDISLTLFVTAYVRRFRRLLQIFRFFK
ncbi:MAG: hypothetical protein IJ292_01985 [Clostridia bacterium]|nr:hypothetical protein [Clostridia bacterium]